jgi:hypothetical protein
MVAKDTAAGTALAKEAAIMNIQIILEVWRFISPFIPRRRDLRLIPSVFLTKARNRGGGNRRHHLHYYQDMLEQARAYLQGELRKTATRGKYAMQILSESFDLALLQDSPA